MITHIWTCARNPSAYGKVEVDDSELEVDGFLDKAQDLIAEHYLRVAHTHIFNLRSSPNGLNVFHECEVRG